jgi:hypothetical protein
VTYPTVEVARLPVNNLGLLAGRKEGFRAE